MPIFARALGQEPKRPRMVPAEQRRFFQPLNWRWVKARSRTVLAKARNWARRSSSLRIGRLPLISKTKSSRGLPGRGGAGVAEPPRRALDAAFNSDRALAVRCVCEATDRHPRPSRLVFLTMDPPR